MDYKYITFIKISKKGMLVLLLGKFPINIVTLKKNGIQNKKGAGRCTVFEF